jgi:serine/threonine protein kinase
MAPEILMSEPVGIPADLYAVGMMGYEMITGKHPFSVNDVGVYLCLDSVRTAWDLVVSDDRCRSDRPCDLALADPQPNWAQRIRCRPYPVKNRLRFWIGRKEFINIHAGAYSAGM